MLKIILFLISINIEASVIDFKILSTTDIHSNLMNYNYEEDKEDNTVGLVKIATLIKQERNDNTILLDNGDAFVSGAIDYYIITKNKETPHYKKNPIYTLMNHLKYDAGVIGNHDFNYDLDYLNLVIKSANFPILSSNIYYDEKGKLGKNYFTPYVILEKELKDNDNKKHKLKIALIGLTPTQIMAWDGRFLKGKVLTTDLVATAKKYVKEVKEKGADLVIIMSHSGVDFPKEKYEEMTEDVSWYLTQIKDVTAVTSGHSHKLFPSEAFKDLKNANLEKGTINNVPVVQAGYYGSHLGVINIKIEKTNDKINIIDSRSKVLPIYKKEGTNVISLVEADKESQKIVEKIHGETIKFMRTPIGEIDSDLNTYATLASPTKIISFINSVQKDKAKEIVKGTKYENLPILSTAAPFKTGGRDRLGKYSSVKKGKISILDVNDIYMHTNNFFILKFTGNQLKEFLEKAVSGYETIPVDNNEPKDLIKIEWRDYNFAQISGITYKIDLTKPNRYDLEGKLINPDSYRISSLKYEGKELKDTQEFLLATNSYRATGGGSFPYCDGSTIAIKTEYQNRDLIKEYVRKHKNIKIELEDNWSFIPNFKNTYFVSSANSELEKTDKFKTYKTLDNGLKVYWIK